MANNRKVMDSIKDFLLKMKALDEAIPEELAQDACEMVEGVKEGLADELPNPLEITKDEEAEEKEEKVDIDKKVEDAFVRVMHKYGLIRDESMKSLEDVEEECTKDADNEEAVTVDPEKMNDGARRELIRKIKPIIACVKDASQRKALADSFAEVLKMNKNNSNQYGDILLMRQKNAQDSMHSMKQTKVEDNYGFGMNVAERFNPHYKKEDK